MSIRSRNGVEQFVVNRVPQRPVGIVNNIAGDFDEVKVKIAK